MKTINSRGKWRRSDRQGLVQATDRRSLEGGWEATRTLLVCFPALYSQLCEGRDLLVWGQGQMQQCERQEPDVPSPVPGSQIDSQSCWRKTGKPYHQPALLQPDQPDETHHGSEV